MEKSESKSDTEENREKGRHERVWDSAQKSFLRPKLILLLFIQYHHTAQNPKTIHRIFRISTVGSC